ncbi:hypothetical protein N9W11_04810 [Psychrosphaera haliotis]|nr:hypothetical protein [Psychrosphaera haliotis]
MESKTFPITSTQSNTKSDTSTSQQASVLFKQLSQHLADKPGQLNNQLQQQSLVVPDKLKAELSLWLTSKPAPTIESMPAAIKNWLVPALNQLQAQQGLSSLTLSQWLPLITKMQLLNSAPNAQTAAALAQTAALANNSTLLRISWLIGSSSLASKSSSVSQVNQAMVGGLLKLLIPISMQDKASLIIREQSQSLQQSQQAEQAKQTNEQAQLTAAQEQDQNRVNERSSSSTGQSDTPGNNQALSFSLTFDLDDTGLLVIDINLNALNLQSICTCSNTPLLQKVEKYWPMLQERLSKFGFSVKNESIVDENLALAPEHKGTRLIDIKV